MDQIADFFGNLIKVILLWIDGLIYTFSSTCYRIFFVLGTTNFFDTTTYGFLIRRVEVILGTVMLFYSAYFILTNMSNPQKAFGGDAQKQIINFITTIVLLIFMPVIFNFVDSVHTTVIKSNVIPNFLFGTDGNSSNIAENLSGQTLSNSGMKGTIKGNYLTELLYECFLHLNPGHEDSEANEPFEIIIPIGPDCTPNSKGDNTYCYGEKVYINKYSSAKGYSSDSGDYYKFTNFSQKIDLGSPDTNELYYFPIVSTLAGIGLCYMLITYCIELSSRIFKLAVLQIIFPIPVFARILPQKKEMFSKWVKELTKVYLEVIIKIFTLYLMVLMVALLFAKGNDGMSLFDNVWKQLVEAGGTDAYSDIQWLITAFIILGFLMFAKQFPKFLTETLGISSGSLSVGMKKWGEFFKPGVAIGSAAVGAAGAGLLGGMRNFAGAKNADGSKASFGRRLRSGIAGLGSGATRGLVNGAKSKKLKDVVTNVNKATNNTTEARKKREATNYRYYANGQNTVTGHIADAWTGAKQFVGVETETVSQKESRYKKIKGSVDAAKSAAATVRQKASFSKVAVNGLLDESGQKISSANWAKITENVDITDENGRKDVEAFQELVTRHHGDYEMIKNELAAFNSQNVSSMNASERAEYARQKTNYARLMEGLEKRIDDQLLEDMLSVSNGQMSRDQLEARYGEAYKKLLSEGTDLDAAVSAMKDTVKHEKLGKDMKDLKDDEKIDLDRPEYDKIDAVMKKFGKNINNDAVRRTYDTRGTGSSGKNGGNS